MSDYKELYNYEYTINDVADAYNGAVGLLWEALMGDHIHVGGIEETKKLADLVDPDESTYLLDICSALGGPARYLAQNYKTKILGLDYTETMLDKATKRTEEQGLSDLIEYRKGNAMDMPLEANSFDVVWGQDAWCYVEEKDKLIKEAVRVCKKGGKIAFTDWIHGPEKMTAEESDKFHEFMIFPNMETFEGYRRLLEENNCKIIKSEELHDHFAKHVKIYLNQLQEMKEQVISGFGEELYEIAENGIKLMERISDEGKIGRGLWIAEKQ
jgi:ubiquinone/menaquinone biosynthesis C-methylase UbiE